MFTKIIAFFLAIIQFCILPCAGLFGRHQIVIDKTKKYQTFEEFGTSSCWWAQTISDDTMAREIAKKVGISKFVANVLPAQKQEKINSLKQNGAVAMVGDGINDAPALMSADIGIAIGAGTDIAMESADIVLMGNGLLQVVRAIELSRAVIKNIKGNLFWALFYNSLCIPLATGLFGIHLDPAFAAAAMSFSSVFVVTNALRLRNWKGNKNIKVGGKKMEKKIYIEGMMCQHCAAHAKAALEGIDGVEAVTVEL